MVHSYLPERVSPLESLQLSEELRHIHLCHNVRSEFYGQIRNC